MPGGPTASRDFSSSVSLEAFAGRVNLKEAEQREVPRLPQAPACRQAHRARPREGAAGRADAPHAATRQAGLGPTRVG